ncbi:hypothetical protein [Salmonirosea aquatica]|uniref:Lipocalin-like domain-containing protein n=1 Tax=Salmonirosea aquatica TaxID=2654236 RepID=A0A7C9BBF4_9BACT|nr:hypothetical protein [Cytophagaceae bacterium SJW1-29]
MMKTVHSYTFCLTLVVCAAWKTDLPADTTSTSYHLTKATANRIDFSGEWKLNESESKRDGNFPICILGEQDHIRSKTMKIAEQAGFLTLDVTSPSIDGELVPRKEKLAFDGKEREALVVGSPREESTARWSDDGQTMTVSSARFLDDYSEKAVIKVTEIWKLINDGKSIAISVQVDRSGWDTMKLVYNRQ